MSHTYTTTGKSQTNTDASGTTTIIMTPWTAHDEGYAGGYAELHL